MSAEHEEQPEKSTRDRLVKAARTLFLRQGYEATSISEILREAGVNSGSLYYAFKTKEALLLAVLDRYCDMLYPAVFDHAFARHTDPIDRIFAVLGGYRQMLLMTDFRQGCPIGNLALEMSDRSDLVRQKIALNFEGWRVAVRKLLQEAGDWLPAAVDRDRLATFILTVMEGAVMQCRAYRTIEPYDASVAMLRDYVDRLMADAWTEAGEATPRSRGIAPIE